MGAVVPDEKVEFYLLDRVINVLPNTAVPAGLCGTITAIYGQYFAQCCHLASILVSVPARF